MTNKEKLAKAEKHLAMWEEAMEAIATSQSYSIAGKSITRANLKEVLEMIEFYEKKVSQLETAVKNKGRNRIIQAIPQDFFRK
ncbi:MAG: DUF6148 family protein [Eubacteriales bacterium]